MQGSVIPKINFLTEVTLYNEMLNSQGEIIVFDLRSKVEFDECRLPLYSINLPHKSDEITYEFCNIYDPSAWEAYTNDSNTKKSLKRLKRYFIVIVTQSKPISKPELRNVSSKLKSNTELSDAESSWFKGLVFYNMLLQNKIREIGFFIGDFTDFVHQFNLVCLYNHSKKVFNDPYPSCILDNRLYVGDESHVKSLEVLKHLKITHIINVTFHVPNKFENEGIKYLRIPIDDSDLNHATPYFPQAYEFIENALFNEDTVHVDESSTNFPVCQDIDFSLVDEEIEFLNQKLKDGYCIRLKNEIIQLLFQKMLKKSFNYNRVIIHCSLGVSRSACFAIMYIMKKFGLSSNEAFELVKMQRNKSCPIEQFMNDLQEFENSGYSFNF